MCGKTCLALSTVLVVFISFYMYNPTPDGVEEIWKYRLFLAGMKFMDHMAQVYEYFGGSWGDFMHLTSKHTDFLTKVSSDSRLKVYNDEFNGVRVRIYDPLPNNIIRPGLVYLHGGGFYMGTPELFDQTCAYLAKKLDIFVVSVAYTLAPVPAPLTDVESASMYLFTNAAKYKVDASKIAVAGDSAGGNLAASICLKFRDDKNKYQFRAQGLIYPLLQVFDMVDVPSYNLNMWHAYAAIHHRGLAYATLRQHGADHKHTEAFLQNKHVSKSKREQYRHLVDWSLLPAPLLSHGYKPSPPPDGDAELVKVLEEGTLNPHNFPLMAENLSGLPPAYIIAMQHDTVRDDAILYYIRLQKNGVRSELRHVDSGWHGMISFAEGILAMEASRDLLDGFGTFLLREFTTEQ